VLIALTFGQLGAGEPDFFAQLSQVIEQQLLFLVWSLMRASGTCRRSMPGRMWVSP
jgi:hypothetical protein